MAKKVKCPSCGAKNAADSRRCRVCTAVINAEAAEAPAKGELKSKQELEAIEAARDANQREFDASELHQSIDASGGPRLPNEGEAPIPAPSYGAPAPASGESRGNGSGPGVIDINVTPRHQGNAPPLFADGAVDSFSGHDFGVQIDAVSRHPGDPEPIEVAGDERPWDADVRGIEFTREPGGPVGPPASAATEAEKYLADPTGNISYDEVLSRHPGDPEPPPPQPGELPLDAVPGIELDVMSRNPDAPPPPPLPSEEEQWDARKGGIEFDPSIWVAENPPESE